MNKVGVISEPEVQQQMPLKTEVQSEPQSVATENVNSDGSTYEVCRSCSQMNAYINSAELKKIRYKIIGCSNPKFAKKVKNAVGAYANTVLESQIFALYDDTFFGSAKEGFIMTVKGIWIKTFLSQTHICSYSEITGIKVIYDENAKLTKVFLCTQKGNIQLCASLGENSIVFAQEINNILKYLFGLDKLPFVIERK